MSEEPAYSLRKSDARDLSIFDVATTLAIGPLMAAILINLSQYAANLIVARPFRRVQTVLRQMVAVPL